jgi:membrane protein implicated in regulation of membrane protease activity
MAACRRRPGGRPVRLVVAVEYLEARREVKERPQPMDGDPSAVGSTGVLTVGTRGVAGPGEILVRIRGGSETYLAWSDEPLPKGTTVLVVESRGARSLTVVSWRGSSLPDPGPHP